MSNNCHWEEMHDATIQGSAHHTSPLALIMKVCGFLPFSMSYAVVAFPAIVPTNWLINANQLVDQYQGLLLATIQDVR